MVHHIFHHYKYKDCYAATGIYFGTLFSFPFCPQVSDLDIPAMS
jgi:hypothetical protein